ncbi:unnamed protein product [Xylocopa violacea]|uniref:Ribosomal protein mS38 C-terminal domain-containing protein n=1 Tax=Xylocopa violacea TaxID=135666 RepID=A0ABP1MZY1_XYLVO
MAINRLCAEFRKIVINRQSNIIARYCSSQISKEQNGLPPNFSKHVLNVAFPAEQVTFIPRTLNIDFKNPDSITNKSICEIPLSIYIPSIEDPLRQPIQQDQPVIEKSVELPSTENILEKLAVHMIRIRRQKMKKHKRKKFRKRMKFVWAKIRARRNILKEKTFQAALLAKIKTAHAFDAKKYVEERLAIIDKEKIPLTFRGEILPQNMIKQLIEEKKEQNRKRFNKPRLTLD